MRTVSILRDVVISALVPELAAGRYYTMAFVIGASLRQRLVGETVQVSEGVRIGLAPGSERFPDVPDDCRVRGTCESEA